MQMVQPLAGRYRFLQHLTSTPRAVWLAQDDTSGFLVVAAQVPSRLAKQLAPCVGVQHPHLACLLSVLQPVWLTELPEGTKELPDGAVAVAEWVAGRSIYDALLQGPLTMLDAAQALAAITTTVAALHAQRACHGSISARSVLLERFNAGPIPVLTQIAMPADGSYASPERLGGMGPSRVDDVWALHVLLYVALTGRRPFRAKTRDDLIRIVSKAHPVPLQAFGVHDQELQAIVDDGLRPDPESRTSTAKELDAKLTRWLAAHRLERTSEPADATAAAQEFELTLDIPSPVSSPPGEAAKREATEATPSAGQRIAIPITGFDASQPSLAPDVVDGDDAVGAVLHVEIPALDALPSIATHDQSTPAPAVGSADATPIPTGDSVPPPPPESNEPPQHTPAEAAAPIPVKVERRAGTARFAILAAALLAIAAVGGVVAYGLLHQADRRTASAVVAPGLATAATSIARPALSAPAALLGPPSEAVPEVPVPPAAPVGARTPADITQCVAGMFTPDTFGIPQDLSFLCDEIDPRKGSVTLRTKIVRGSGGKRSGGTNEWPRLLWHELAVYGIMRRKCCPGAPPIKLPASKGPCPPLEDTINDLSTEISGNTKDLRPQLDKFDAAALCALRIRDKAYRYPTGPKTGGQVFFYEILRRNGYDQP